MGRCRYESQKWADDPDGYNIWICVIHHTGSKHDVIGLDSDVPCLSIDPLPHLKES